MLDYHSNATSFRLSFRNWFESYICYWDNQKLGSYLYMLYSVVVLTLDDRCFLSTDYQLHLGDSSTYGTLQRTEGITIYHVIIFIKIIIIANFIMYTDGYSRSLHINWCRINEMTITKDCSYEMYSTIILLNYFAKYILSISESTHICIFFLE